MVTRGYNPGQLEIADCTGQRCRKMENHDSTYWTMTKFLHYALQLVRNTQKVLQHED